MRLSRLSPFAFTAALLLGGCVHGNILKKDLPDETQVVDGPSLALPPNFELRPPREAEDYESVLRAQKTIEAQSLITGVSPTAAGGEAAAGDVPAGDAWLVKQVGTQAGVAADPNVREQLDSMAKTDAAVEESKDDKAKKGLLKRWFGSSDE